MNTNSLKSILCIIAIALAASLVADALPKRRVIEVKRSDGPYVEIALSRKASRQIHRAVKGKGDGPEVIFGRYIKAQRIISARIHTPLPEADRKAPTIRRKQLWRDYSLPLDTTSKKTRTYDI